MNMCMSVLVIGLCTVEKIMVVVPNGNASTSGYDGIRPLVGVHDQVARKDDATG